MKMCSNKIYVYENNLMTTLCFSHVHNVELVRSVELRHQEAIHPTNHLGHDSLLPLLIVALG